MHKPRLSRLALLLPLAAVMLSGCIVVPRGYGGHHHHGRDGYYHQNAQEAAQVQPAPRGRGDWR